MPCPKRWPRACSAESQSRGISGAIYGMRKRTDLAVAAARARPPARTNPCAVRGRSSSPPAAAAGAGTAEARPSGDGLATGTPRFGSVISGLMRDTGTFMIDRSDRHDRVIGLLEKARQY